MAERRKWNPSGEKLAVELASIEYRKEGRERRCDIRSQSNADATPLPARVIRIRHSVCQDHASGYRNAVRESGVLFTPNPGQVKWWWATMCMAWGMTKVVAK